MPLFRLCRALAVAALYLLAVSTFPAAAEQPRGLPSASAYMYLTPDDVRLVSDITDRLLESGRPGNVASWKNDRSGNFGTMELERSFRDEGVLCKQIDHVIKYNNVSDARLFHLTFCRIGGEWKLAG